MTFHAGLFFPALAVLLFPADWMLTRFVELRRFDDFHSMERGKRHRPWWWVAALWIDPLRGFAGTWALMSSLDLKFGQWDKVPVAGYSLMIVVVAVAVVVQMITRREPGVLLAPIGFVFGILAAVAPWKITAIAATTAVTGMYGFRQFYAFFALGFGAIGFLGLIMSAGPGWLVPGMVAFGVPPIVGLVTGRGFELPTRNAAGKFEMPKYHKAKKPKPSESA